MSNFLINHFARAIVKTVRTQSKAKKSRSGFHQELGNSDWMDIFMGFLGLGLVAAIVVIVLF